MKTCPRCNHSFAKDTSYCHKCGYDPLKPSVVKIKKSKTNRKIGVAIVITLMAIVVIFYFGFGL